jgi:MFS family permease
MASAPNRLASLRNLQVATWDAAFASAFGSLVGGTILIGFIRELGGGDLWVQLSIAVPSLIGLAQIPGAIWGRSFGWYRKFTAPGACAWRLLYIPLIALPFLPLDNNLRLILLFSLITVATLSNNIVTPIYNEWIAEMVPSTSRGWYFSRRQLISAAVGVVAAFIGGGIVDYFGGLERGMLGYGVTFAFGIVCALISMALFLRMDDLPRDNPVKTTLAEGMRQLKSPLRDRNFQVILFFTVLFAASQGFSGAFYATYALDLLKLPMTIVQLFGVSHAISVILFIKMWGFLADKYGNKPILMMNVLGTVLTPGLWLLTHPAAGQVNVVILLIGHLFNGLVWSGVGVTQNNIYIATAKPEDRANYLAASSAVTAVALTLSPFAGAAALGIFRAHFPAEWAYKYVFIIVMVLRLASLIPLAPVKEKGARPLRETMSQLRRVSPRGLRAFRAIAASSDVAERERALEGVGRSKFSLAGDELIRALGDPSPRVRRQAAQSLGHMASPEIGRKVIKHLHEHPDLAEEETLEVLGECDIPEAVQLLSRYLEDPRSILRRAAAKSLGRLGDPAAVEPLKEAAREAGDPDLRRAAIQALRVLCATDAADVIGEALFDAHPSIRIAAAEAVAELEMRDLASTLRESIQWFQDETASEMSYALGVVGEVNDIPLILSVAGEMVSPTLRRRCLMGLARLLGVEREFYKMLGIEGIGRDEVLVRRARQSRVSVAKMRAALERYSSGDEPEALHLLARAVGHPALEMMAEQPVEEAFLAGFLFATGGDPVPTGV